MQQLNFRKSKIQDRLINTDEDPALTRAQLRGEVEGLEYAVNVINKFRERQ